MRDGSRDGEITRRLLLGTATTAFATLLGPTATFGRGGAVSVGTTLTTGSFPLIENGKPAAIYVDDRADPAVLRVADSFAADLERVSGRLPRRIGSFRDGAAFVVIIGAIGQSPIIDSLAREGKIDVSDLHGEWEAFRQMVVDNPIPGVARALIIAGADRRGAVFGTYDISERIGISPWHWFADVPVQRRSDVFIATGSRRDQPKVRYRGFFINDEDPCFSSWAKKKFGGINSKLYAHVFELLLRMKGNYLWPAMWAPKAFAADDPQNMVLADAMGVVMATSHHEAMMRAQDEWHRDTDKGITGGQWDYTSNAENLRSFWRGGIERMMSKGAGGGYESVITVGMRGDGDKPMAEGTATDLLERIVTDQRAIIADVTGDPASKTPQVWALYKEVQDYYDHGMEVPDDVTLLFSDDNWGQVRRLPAAGAAPRAGGYGIYYHFDYVGGPRNYKWINTNQIEKTWQQMDLAYQRGVRQIWVVNVGDIKPMEYPLGFFLAMAWNPEAMTHEALAAYPSTWARATFGGDQAAAIGEMITAYSRYAARRKPELIDQDSFPLGGGAGPILDGGEFGEMVADWDALERQMLSVKARLRSDQLDAYFQLLEYPIAALANLYRLYYAAAWNKRLASGNDSRANYFADEVEATFRRDRELMDRYNGMNGGKWDGMMTQVHMSYVIWKDPTQQTMPSITRVGRDTPADRIGRKIEFSIRRSAQPGVIAIEAPNFNRVRNGEALAWTVIPNLGRTRGAVVALPQGRPATSLKDRVCLEYDATITVPGPATVSLYLAPTLATSTNGVIQIGVSVGDGPVKVLSVKLRPGGGPNEPDERAWAQAVRDNIHIVSADMGDLRSGRHSVKVWRLDDNAVLQKLVISTVPVAASYLGASSII
jgi:hypothetical protein